MHKKEFVLFEILRIEESDRLMAITRDDSGELIGLNYCHGIDSGIDQFKIGDSNDELLHFVKDALRILEKSHNDIQFIDKLIWLHLQGVIDDAFAN